MNSLFIYEFIYKYTQCGEMGAPNMAIRVFQMQTKTQTSALAQRRWRVTESVTRRLRLVTESVTESVTRDVASDSGCCKWGKRWRVMTCRQRRLTLAAEIDSGPRRVTRGWASASEAGCLAPCLKGSKRIKAFFLFLSPAKVIMLNCDGYAGPTPPLTADTTDHHSYGL